MLKRDPHCNRCGLCETAEYICLLGQGPQRCDIMIIGEAPGQREDDSGKPFVGRSGQLLNELLESSGLKRSQVYITNAVKCRPEDNRTPKKKEIEACKYWLQKEIATVKPKYVLILGNIPLQSLHGLKGIRKLRGMPIEKDGIIYFPTYHPSYTLHDERQRPVLASDIKMFAKIVKKGGIEPEKGLNYKIVKSWDDVILALADIKKTHALSIDTEDTSLRHFQPGFEVVSVGIGTKDTQWCFPLSHPEGWLANKPHQRKRLIKKLDGALRGHELIMQNGKFDTLAMAVEYGVWWYCDFDVMLAHYNLDENHPHDLGIMSQVFFDAIDYDIPLPEKQGKGPLERHCKYLALDVYYTRKLRFKFKSMLEADEATEKIFYKFTMPVARMFADVEYKGCWLDKKQLGIARRKYKQQADDAWEELNKLVPDKRQWKDKKNKRVMTGVNWGSPKQLGEVLFKRLQVKPLDKTPKGENSTSESVLLRLAKESGIGGKVARLILLWREGSKNIGTFTDAWERHAINSRIHPSFKIHGTTTGRPSCDSPNLQQTPRNPILRSCISAPPGYVMVDSDQSQAEMRIAAELTQDPVLKRIYQTGGDVHTKTVQDLLGIANPDKDQRKKGKAINFGFIFGMWWKKFIIYARDNYDIEFTPREAQEARAGFFRLYATFPNWHKRQKRFAAVHGYVRSLIGRKRRLPAAMRRDDSMECREAERQAINSPVQSLASDITLMGALAIHGDYMHDTRRRIKGAFEPEICHIVGTIHDAILKEVKVTHLRQVAKKVKALMEWPPLLDEFNVKMSVPLVSEIEVGAWGVGEKIEDLLKAA